MGKIGFRALTRSSVIYLALSPLIYKTWKNGWYDSHPLAVSVGSIALMFFPHSWRSKNAVLAVMGFLKETSVVGTVQFVTNVTYSAKKALFGGFRKFFGITY